MIKTPETDPNHEYIGQFFDAYDGKVYYCDSWDSRWGFWMTDIKDHSNRKNISINAIDRTFHLIRKDIDNGSGWSLFRPHIKKEDMPIFQTN